MRAHLLSDRYKSMKRKIFYGLLLAALALNLFVGTQVYIQNVGAAEKDDPYPNLKLYSTVLERVCYRYAARRSRCTRGQQEQRAVLGVLPRR